MQIFQSLLYNFIILALMLKIKKKERSDLFKYSLLKRLSQESCEELYTAWI